MNEYASLRQAIFRIGMRRQIFDRKENSKQVEKITKQKIDFV